MAIDSRTRSQLASLANRVKATLTVSAGEPSPAAIEHIRNAFRREEIVKVRIRTDTSIDRDLVAAHIARAVPCDIVNCIGRVATLYRKREEPSEEEMQ